MELVEGNRLRVDKRDALPSTVVVDLFMNAQPTSEHGRAHAYPEPAPQAKGRVACCKGGRRSSRTMYEYEQSDGLIVPMKP